MITIVGQPDKHPQFCDKIARRNFLKIGALGFGGLTLPQLLAAEAQAGARSSHKSVIMIYLVGGPPHQDMFDIKTEAPREIAGPFRPIRTNVPGIDICEHMPRLARMMDKFVPIRSIVGAQSDHTAYQCYSGRVPAKNTATGDFPQLGSAVAKLQGPVHADVPPFVSLCYTCTHGPYNEPGPGFLGISQSPFRPMGPIRDDMVLKGVSVERLNDRKALLAGMDNWRRDVDASGTAKGMDAFTTQALRLLTSSKLAEALDLSREDPRTVARYGTGDPTVFMDGNGAPRVPQSMLLARRLVEAGARIVTLNYSKWDWHSNTFRRAKEDNLAFDQAITALVDDLHQRGLDKDVTVLAWGEFGRTPMINKQAGRDHWPRVSCALLAGGGMKTGQVIGATDRLGGEAVKRPVTFPEVFATLYHNLGIDVDTATVTDLNGRLQYLVDGGAKPIKELV
ncbi:MAG TPA: DUF1501 domain-containing protein [Gemmataceae bacterium]|nr:DUF1501 domain-containing protein [Gemmataceae bacterium]